MKILIGCCGFPAARKAYFERFPLVEVNSTFTQLPQHKTTERWAQEAPPGFIWSVKAWQAITHPHTSPAFQRLRPRWDSRKSIQLGHFRDNNEVREAWERFTDAIEPIKPRFILFQTPSSFHPSADHLRDMYRFFKRVRRSGAVFVWEPRGAGWADRLITKVCRDLSLQHAVDPFVRKSLAGNVHYYRMHGRVRGRSIERGHGYGDDELKGLVALCEGKPAFVFFSNHSMWKDAWRCKDLLDPIPGQLARAAARIRRRRSLL